MVTSMEENSAGAMSYEYRVVSWYVESPWLMVSTIQKIIKLVSVYPMTQGGARACPRGAAGSGVRADTCAQYY
ncbi:unnamed protein product, partial [Brenthis ino]